MQDYYYPSELQPFSGFTPGGAADPPIRPDGGAPFGPPGGGPPFAPPGGGPPFGLPGGGPPFGPPGGGPPFGPPGGGQPSGSGPPTGAPPAFVPSQATAQQFAGVLAVNPGAIRPCIFRYVYLWLDNGQQFWAWLVFAGSRSVAGWRWIGFRWIYFGIDTRSITSFVCF